jgi:hypothetical protein
VKTSLVLALCIGLTTSLIVVGALPGCGGGAGGTGAGSGGSKPHPTPEGGMDAPAEAGPPGLTCSKLLFCDQACNGDACTNGCYAKATGVAQGLFDAFNNCINTQCPADASANCQQSAATGACAAFLSSCFADTSVGPPDPDGGGVVVPHVDAGPLLNCGQFTACVAACSGDGGSCASMCGGEATSEAKALAGVLNGCLATACPSADGGPCAMAGTACNGCVEQVEFGGSCSAPYQACQNDVSNAPDAGPNPTVLEDGGALSTILMGIDQVGSTMIVQGSYLYFAQEGSSNQVSRIPLVDGGTVTTLGPPQPTPVALAVDANNAYVWNYGTFTGSSSLNNGDGTVNQVPLAGGPQVTIGKNIEVFYAAPYLNAIAVDATNVYWVQGANGSDGVIMKTPIGSTTGTPLYMNQFFPEGLVTDGVNLFWVNWGTFDAMGNSNNDGTLMQGSVNGGAPITLASKLSAPACVAIDSKNVYWTNLGKMGGGNLPALNTGSVMQVPIGGGQVVTLDSQESVPVSIAVKNGVVYWTEYGLGSLGLVLSVPSGGGTVVPLVAGLRNPYSLALSSNTLYWSYYQAASPSSANNVVIEALSPY